MLIPGNKLTPDQRRQVLRAFIYRWTSDNPRRRTVYNCPHCNLTGPATTECVVFRENVLGYLLPNKTLGILAASVIRGAGHLVNEGWIFIPVTATGKMNLSQFRPASLADFAAFNVSAKGYNLAEQVEYHEPKG